MSTHVKRTTVAVAAAAAGLICTWDTPTADAAVYQFDGSITPAQPLSHVYFLIGTGNCATEVYSRKISDHVPGGQTTIFSVNVEIPDGKRSEAWIWEGYTILGIYDDANDGVTVAYGSLAASKILAANPVPQWTDAGQMPGYRAWADAVYQSGVWITESAVADYLRTGGGVDNFAEAGRIVSHGLYDVAPSTSETNLALLNFSTPSAGGTATLVDMGEVVPEPGALMSVLVLPAALLMRRRRRSP